MKIHGIENHMAYCGAMGLSKCFEAYANECAMEDIQDVGFNPSLGYVYIALENCVQIRSMLGRDVEYLVTNFENGKETFYNNYKEALENL